MVVQTTLSKCSLMSSRVVGSHNPNRFYITKLPWMHISSRQVYLYSTFHTQRQFKVLHKGIKMKEGWKNVKIKLIFQMHANVHMVSTQGWNNFPQDSFLGDKSVTSALQRKVRTLPPDEGQKLINRLTMRVATGFTQIIRFHLVASFLSLHFPPWHTCIRVLHVARERY